MASSRIARASRYSPLNLLGDARSLRNCDWRTISGTSRAVIGSSGRRTAVIGASCREARAGVRRARVSSSFLARDANDLMYVASPNPATDLLPRYVSHIGGRRGPAYAG